MNLTDIEKAVVELSIRHPSLTKEFLRTLLEASGWEEKHIKEAQIIFAAHTSVSSPNATVTTEKVEHPVAGEHPTTPAYSQVTNSSNSNDITFLRSDGEEEGELHIDESQNVEKREDSEQKVAHSATEENVEETVSTRVEQVVPEEKTEERESKKSEEVTFESNTHQSVEEQSLIREIKTVRQEKSQTWSELPDNLPLVPFESAPHVWSFGRYKDTFFAESKVEDKKVESVNTSDAYVQEKKEVPPLAPTVTEISKPTVISQPPSSKNGTKVEIDFEKTPISKGEESLVVLAGIMLLAIMLILGYMYGNGRL